MVTTDLEEAIEAARDEHHYAFLDKRNHTKAVELRVFDANPAEDSEEGVWASGNYNFIDYME